MTWLLRDWGEVPVMVPGGAEMRFRGKEKRISILVKQRKKYGLDV